MNKAKRYHLIGIAGAGMSGLARVLHSRGAVVTGSDSSASEVLTHLQSELGVELFVGNAEENIDRAKPDIVVVTAAVKDDNAELLAAKRRGLPIVARAEFLGSLMSEYPMQIAVTGTHGKTTTTAMVAQMLASAGLAPTALVGSNVPNWNSNTLIGGDQLIVAEACEAFGSFLSILPTHAVITNIEADHLDHYGTLDTVVDAFREFVRQTSEVVVCCVDKGCSDLIAADAGSKLITYGIGEGDFQAVEIGDGQFDVVYDGRDLGMITIAAPGRHNVLNALSAVALGMSLQLPFEKISAGLATFAGTERRFEVLGETSDGAILIDDYAHHPTEIRATLAAARQKYPGRKIIVLFQPHLPSRTQQLMDEFSQAFFDADYVVVSDIYLARESAIPGVDSEVLAHKIQEQLGCDRAIYGGDLKQSSELLHETIATGSIVVTMGAGNVRSAAERILMQNRALEAK